MTARLLVDAAEFCAQLEEDLREARQYVSVQAMTFEGDAAGRRLADMLLACRAPDRRLLVDFYIKYKISDRLVHAPAGLLDRELRHEVRQTGRLIEHLREAGVQVRFTGARKFLPGRLLGPDHKKMVVVDDRLAYLGGINFSDHNFAWHDLMVRLEDGGAARFLRQDFLDTWEGRGRCASWHGRGIDIHSLDGCSNETAFAPLLTLLRAAQREVVVESAYLTHPFFGVLRALRRRGVAVTVITPRENNRRLLGDYIRWEAARCDLDLRLYGGRMLHLKAMLIDGCHLVVGSPNFDYLSYRTQPEVFAVLADPGLIAEFRQRVIAPDLERCDAAPGPRHAVRGRLVGWSIHALGPAVAWLGRG
ncbi:MAG TPA: phosphatidylserine/phosphatidylglycerophosphate/cardiolipin synthase family protein [Vicinamibacterales bacterium]|nr:phosphatidylserine/phosphatidylglycerophosphate/cardiolipin synthase family protein [Vicinamibacterales bacterium]